MQHITRVTMKVDTKDADYIGRIDVFEGRRKLWSKRSGIRRLTRVDAMTDARNMAHDVLCENGLRLFTEEAAFVAPTRK